MFAPWWFWRNFTQYLGWLNTQFFGFVKYLQKKWLVGPGQCMHAADLLRGLQIYFDRKKSQNEFCVFLLMLLRYQSKKRLTVLLVLLHYVLLAIVKMNSVKLRYVNSLSVILSICFFTNFLARNSSFIHIYAWYLLFTLSLPDFQASLLTKIFS